MFSVCGGVKLQPVRRSLEEYTATAERAPPRSHSSSSGEPREHSKHRLSRERARERGQQGEQSEKERWPPLLGEDMKVLLRAFACMQECRQKSMRALASLHDQHAGSKMNWTFVDCCALRDSNTASSNGTGLRSELDHVLYISSVVYHPPNTLLPCIDGLRSRLSSTAYSLVANLTPLSLGSKRIRKRMARPT